MADVELSWRALIRYPIETNFFCCLIKYLQMELSWLSTMHFQLAWLSWIVECTLSLSLLSSRVEKLAEPSRSLSRVNLFRCVAVHLFLHLTRGCSAPYSLRPKTTYLFLGISSNATCFLSVGGIFNNYCAFLESYSTNFF